MEVTGIWELSFFANTLANWISAGVIALVVVTVLVVVKRTVIRQLKKMTRQEEREVSTVAAYAVSKTRVWVIVVIAIWAGSLALVLPVRLAALVQSLAIIAILLQIATWASAAANRWLGVYTEKNIESDAAAVTSMRAVVFIGRLLGWSLVLLLALDNLGVDITALIAGLGIGGIAVALAVQNILGDLFASLSIVIDKPFVVGDFIIVGEHLGTVQHIGLKTTRVASLSGEQLIFSNMDLLNSRIRNFKRMNERRVVFSFGVEYETPLEKLKLIPEMVREILDAQELARFDRAHFKEFGAHSLVFEVVYHVLVPDFNQYMDVQQSINLELYARFEEHDISFAFPTQTLYVQNMNGRGGSADALRESGPKVVAD